MKKLIHIDDHSAELVCDNVKCDYVAPPGLHMFGPHLIGLPCPKCAHNLLTEQDYNLQKKIYKRVEWINRIGAFFGLGKETIEPTDKTTSLSVRAVGGTVEIKEFK